MSSREPAADFLTSCFCGLSHWGVESRDRHLLSEVSAGLSTTPIWVSGDAPDDPSLVTAHTEAVAALGVLMVVDLRDPAPGLSEWDVKVFRSAGIEYRRLPIEDASSSFSAGSPEFSRWLSEVSTLPEIPTLVHCHMGVNRSASLAVALLAMRGLPAGEAMSSVLGSRESAMAVYAPLLIRSLPGFSAADADEAAESLRALRREDHRFTRALGF